MNEHPSFLVYSHLPRFFASRGLAPAAGTKLDHPRARFVTEISQIGYFRADAAADDTGRTLVILILAPRGKYAEHGPQLRGLVASLDSDPVAKGGALDEVLVVAPLEVLGKKNMTDVIREFRGRAGPRVYSMVSYRVLSLDVPAAQIVPRHEIMEPAEVAALLARERLALRDLKMMPASDPPVVWLGGRPGQVVRTLAPSDAAGEAYDYWLLIDR